METSTIILIVVAIIAVMLIIYVIATYNALVTISNKVNEAFSTMDVYLKKRWDLIPNLVETVKGYAKHEQDTLEQVVNLRNSAYEKMSNEDKLKTNVDLTKGINKIMALAESYPDLKANQNFLNLSDQLGSCEADIANARKYYNAVVRDYNTKVQMFPSNIVAAMFGKKEKAMFEADEAQRENVEVKF